jgi:hypothetical protein
LQGGFVPSWQTTVVVELAGTTTVVFAGGGGLLLLMQPDNNDALSNKLDKIFILASWLKPKALILLNRRGDVHRPNPQLFVTGVLHSALPPQRQSAPFDNARSGLRAHPVVRAADYWIYCLGVA